MEPGPTDCLSREEWAVAVLIHEGLHFDVEVDGHTVKSGLIGFSIDGVPRGNVRQEPGAYRAGMGATARRFSLDTPIDDVICAGAALFLDTVEGQKVVERKRRNA
jgi:hypothetical protein